MAIFILPTAGTIRYRGKYPNRARYVSASQSHGRYVELNSGVRLWSIDDRTPEFNASMVGTDYSSCLARAVRMTEAQYASLRASSDAYRPYNDESAAACRAARLAIKPEGVALTVHPSHVIGGEYGNSCERCGCGSQTLTAGRPCVPSEAGAAFAGTPEPVAFIPTPEHVLALHAINAWDALCDSDGKAPGSRPAHVDAALALLDGLEESELDAVDALARVTPPPAPATVEGCEPVTFDAPIETLGPLMVTDGPRMVANTTRAVYWLGHNGYVATHPDYAPSRTAGGWSRLDSLMRAKGESEATISRLCDKQGVHIEPVRADSSDMLRAARLVSDAESGLGYALTDGQRRDLLADNTDWHSDRIRATVAALRALHPAKREG